MGSQSNPANRGKATKFQHFSIIFILDTLTLIKKI